MFFGFWALKAATTGSSNRHRCNRPIRIIEITWRHSSGPFARILPTVNADAGHTGRRFDRGVDAFYGAKDEADSAGGIYMGAQVNDLVIDIRTLGCQDPKFQRGQSYPWALIVDREHQRRHARQNPLDIWSLLLQLQAMPNPINSANRTASRRSVLARSPEPRGIFDGAITSHA